jgi:hypothetical protein
MKLNNDLIRLFKEGDLPAFDATYERLYNFVYSFFKQKEINWEKVKVVFLKHWKTGTNIGVSAS